MSTVHVRVIVADDDPGFRQILQEVLSVDYNVVGAAVDGQELVALALEHAPDVVVLDVSMPLMNGFDAMECCRSNGHESRFVFCSANGARSYVQRALTLGAHGYVLKAALWEDLPVAVATVLAGGVFVSPALSAGA